MCNLGEGIYEQGIEQGIDIGENSKAIIWRKMCRKSVLFQN